MHFEGIPVIFGALRKHKATEKKALDFVFKSLLNVCFFQDQEGERTEECVIHQWNTTNISKDPNDQLIKPSIKLLLQYRQMILQGLTHRRDADISLFGGADISYQGNFLILT